MPSMYVLPDEKKSLVEALDVEMGMADLEANMAIVEWKIIDAYLAGCRSFTITDYQNASMVLGFEQYNGRLSLRYEDILRVYRTEAGRYMKLDVTPLAVRKGESLDSLRKASIGHAIITSLARKTNLDKLKKEAIIPFLKYGNFGVAYYEGTDETGNPKDCIELVHPREMRFLPAWNDNVDSRGHGIARKRWVPLEWAEKTLKDKYGFSIKEKEKMDLRPMRLPWGTTAPGESQWSSNWHEAGSVSSGAGSVMHSMESLVGENLSDPHSKRDNKHGGRDYVCLEEIYCYDEDRDYVTRYIVKVGRVIAYDHDYVAKDGGRVLCPLKMVRHTDTGRAFARGFVGPLLSFNDQIEQMLASLFKNIVEIDTFGMLMIPGSSGINPKEWKDGKRPKYAKYEPDIAVPEHKPFAIQPVNAGTLPGQGANIGIDLMEKLSGQGPMFSGQATGRIDSGSAYGFLFDTANMALGMPTNNFADGMVHCYKKMLEQAKRRSDGTEFVELSSATEALAGVVVDPTSGKMSLDANPIPDHWDIKIDIKDRQPRDVRERKAELRQNLLDGLVDPTTFWITAFEENLDIPGAPASVIESYRKAKWQIVALFRDGETPGEAVTGVHTTNPMVQLIAIQAFMNKIEFSLASQEVRDAFEQWKMQIETLAGRGWPGALPAIEDVAQQEQMRQKAMQSGMGPGMGGPPGGGPPQMGGGGGGPPR